MDLTILYSILTVPIQFDYITVTHEYLRHRCIGREDKFHANCISWNPRRVITYRCLSRHVNILLFHHRNHRQQFAILWTLFKMSYNVKGQGFYGETPFDALHSMPLFLEYCVEQHAFVAYEKRLRHHVIVDIVKMYILRQLLIDLSPL